MNLTPQSTQRSQRTEEEKSCPVCLTKLNEHSRTGNYADSYAFDCPRCGKFVFTDTAKTTAPWKIGGDASKRILLSHHIRKSQNNIEWPKFNSDTIEKIIQEKRLPSVFEQCDSVLEWIGNHSTYGGESIVINSPPLELEAFAGAMNIQAVRFCLQSLVDSELISPLGTINFTDMSNKPRTVEVTLTFDGWKRYDELIKGKLSYGKAFMAMKFGDPDLDKIFQNHFKPAVKQTGYDLFKLDEKPEAGLIDIRMRQEIKTSKFIIADLTHDNLGAYWEAGFAEGIGKPVIYTCEESKFNTAKTHFDVNHHLTIKWEKGKEDQAVADLKAAIRYTFPEAKQQDEERETP